MLHSKRFVARGVCDDGGEGLDDAHLVEIRRSVLMVVVFTEETSTACADSHNSRHTRKRMHVYIYIYVCMPATAPCSVCHSRLTQLAASGAECFVLLKTSNKSNKITSGAACKTHFSLLLLSHNVSPQQYRP